MSKAPAFQFYPKDYESDEHVKLMSLAQEGVYLRLMCHQWLHGSIPCELEAIARICRTSVKEIKKLWPGVAPCFPAAEDGRLANRRMSKDNEEMKAWRARKAEAGSAGGRAKAAKQKPSKTPSRNVAPASGLPVAKASPPFSVLQSATATDNGLPAAPAAEPDWNRSAADAYRRQFPKASVPGVMFRVCKPLVEANGWAEVAAELDAYLERVPIDFHNWPKFAAGFGRWHEAPQVRGKPATADNRKVLDEWERKIQEAT